MEQAILFDKARRVILVYWKKLESNNTEVFSSLKNFCDSHPSYSYHTLNNYLSKKKIAYENGEIRLERKPLQTKSPKPELICCRTVTAATLAIILVLNLSKVLA